MSRSTLERFSNWENLNTLGQRRNGHPSAIPSEVIGWFELLIRNPLDRAEKADGVLGSPRQKVKFNR
jgi:hypothetical protein